MTVVDASVALKWFVPERGSSEAKRLLADDVAVEAPDLIIAELCNAAWRLARIGVLDEVACDLVAREAATLFHRLYPPGPIAPRAMVIARAIDHPVYDCFYLALAEERASRLVTADGRLIGRLRGTEWEALAIDLYTLAAMS